MWKGKETTNIYNFNIYECTKHKMIVLKTEILHLFILTSF